MKRFGQILLRKVRPQHIAVPKLAVRRLPQKEVGQPLFAAGTNHQIAIRHRVNIGGYIVHGDLPLTALQRPVHRLYDLLAAAVVDRHIHRSTGVGGGVILQGKILTGCKGAGGEIGHMKVNMDETRVCGCGNKGCLEQYASATGIVNMAKENVPEGSYLADKKVTAKAVFDGAKEGDAYCMEVVEKFGRYLGVALSNVAHVVDPEAFVIGGGVSAAGQILLDVVEKYYNENSMFALKNKSFHLAELGNDAGIYGAVRMVLFK